MAKNSGPSFSKSRRNEQHHFFLGTMLLQWSEFSLASVFLIKHTTVFCSHQGNNETTNRSFWVKLGVMFF